MRNEDENVASFATLFSFESSQVFEITYIKKDLTIFSKGMEKITWKLYRPMKK